MSSTLLNEDLLAGMLAVPPSAESGPDLRTAALLVLLDAYDRRVTREAFFKTAKTAVQLCEMLGRLESTTGINASFTKGTLSAEMLLEALTKITSFAETHRNSLAHDVTLFMQCPEDGETVN